ncbi:hypothetical protein [Terriglobus sp. ADX1]|uniref:hypothetical protein n=1 Tax=Terriglobus sp. ADX1 TaxID=2794063 RepID=UPI002FE613E1
MGILRCAQNDGLGPYELCWDELRSWKLCWGTPLIVEALLTERPLIVEALLGDAPYS